MLSFEKLPHITVDRSGFREPPVSALAHSRSPKDAEFLRRFLAALAEHGLDNDQLVFSGFNGNQITKPELNIGSSPPRIWVMDQRCWQWALNNASLTDTAINYAEYHINPCVGAYDINQLRTDMKGEPDIRLSAIRDTNPQEGICKLVTHVDYPSALPEAALQALVFFDYDQK